MSSVTQLSFSQTLCKAVSVYKTHWKSIIKAGLISVGVLAPFMLLNTFTEAGESFVLYLLTTLLLLLVQIAVWIFFTSYAYDILRDNIQDLKSYVAVVKGRYLPVLKTAILAGLLFLGAILAFLLPAIYLYGSWYFSGYVAILDDKDGMDALRESREITYHRWWEVMAYNMAQSFLSLIAFMVCLVPVGLIFGIDIVRSMMGGAGFGLGTLVSGGVIGLLGAIIFFGIVTPVLYLQMLVIYQNWKQTKIAKKA
jgi:hypothetical protein